MGYNFGEKTEEMNMPVWQSPKYQQSKEKVIEILDSGKYNGLSEADFWILMNKTKTGKMAYTGLIISHNGCLKINDTLEEKKVKANGFTWDKEGFGDSLVCIYQDEDTYEVGEVSKTNCKNAYPYAMAFKRVFDRVVLKKSKLAYSGIYSDSEADEFKDPLEEKETKKRKTKREKEEIRYTQLRTKLTKLNVNFRDGKTTVDYILEKAKVETQDNAKLSDDEIKRLNDVYEVIIAKKSGPDINSKEETY